MRRTAPRPSARRRAFVAALSAVGILLTNPAARAATLTWDPSLVPATPAGGTGTWDLATANWSDGATDAVWTSDTTSNTALFAGTAGTVTVSTPLSALGLQLTTTGYALTGSALTLGTGGIDASTLTSGTTSIANAVTLGGAQSWSIGTGASLTSTGAIDTGSFALTLSSSSTTTGVIKVTGVISNTGSVIKSGTGIASLNATNTYSGGTTINAGLLAEGSANSYTAFGGNGTNYSVAAVALNTSSFGTGAITVNSGGTLGLGFSSTNVGWNSTNYVTANDITLNGGAINAYDGKQHLTGTLTIGAGGGTIGNTFGTDHNKGVYIDGVLAGSGTLTTAFTNDANVASQTYVGSSVWITGTSNTFSGTINATALTNGTNGVFNQGGAYLWLGSSNAISLATLNVVGGNAGSKFQYGGSPVVFAAGTTAYTVGALSGSGGLTLTNTNYYDSSTNVLTTTGGAAVTLSVGNNNSSTTYSGVAGGLGGITKIGSGTTTLTGLNTYSGGTIVNAGTLALGVGGGTGAVRGTLTINSGATVNLTAVDALGYTSGVRVDTVNIVGGTLNNAINGNNGLSTNYVLTGGTMAETVTTTGTNGYNFGAGAGITTNASSTTSVVSGRLAIRSTTWSGFNVASGTTPSGVDLNVSGVIFDSGVAGTVTKSGAGTLALSGTNTYTGVTTLSAGTLSVGTIGNGGVAGNLGQATNAAANLVFDGGTLQYTGATASTNRNFTINASKTATFDVTTNNLTVSGASTTTTGSLTKIGAGTLTLTGANTHTGATAVNAGTLATSGTGTFGAGDVNVAASATLTFGNNASIGDLATLTFANTSNIALGFSGAETLGAVYDSVTATYLTAGTYDATQLNTYFGGISAFTGSGSLTVSAIPEPATYAVFAGLGVLGLAAYRRRRQA